MITAAAVGLSAWLSMGAAQTPAPQPPAGGYWLSVELAESQGLGVKRALSDLREASVAYAPTGPAPPGQLVGHTSRVEDGLVWVARWAFERAVGFPTHHRIHTPPAPVPGGLLWTHRVHLMALVVSGATPDGGLRTIHWPSDAGSILPAALGWKPGALVPSRAPLFAAPAATVPPANERHAMAHRAGGLYVLGVLDRCTEGSGSRPCLRWAQVVVRNGDRFVPGYLPAFQVVRSDAWVPSPGELPRAQIAPSSSGHALARFELVARGKDGTLRRRAIEAPAARGAYPTAMLQVSANRAIVTFPGSEPQEIPLNESFNPRPSPTAG